MDYLKIIREFPNLKEYLKVLITTGSISNEATIGEIFAKLEQELKKARKESSITVEIEKKMWNDPEAHFAGVRAEETIDAQNEVSDLLKLYKIAKSANYTAGMELISSKLGGITPDMIDTISSIGKAHK